jgi:predicted dehydrogenase
LSESITRRDAAKIAGAGALAIAAAPYVQEMRAANEQVGVGVIGTGARGQYHLKHLAGLKSGRCVAVSDPYEPNLRKGIEAARTNPQGSSDYRALLDRKDVQAVIVATPLYTHFLIVKDALLTGKHVLCEKCLVFKPEEIRELKALAGARDSQVVQVGLQRRYSQFYQTAKQMVAKGMLGEVTDIHAQWNRNPGWTMIPDGPRERNWKLYREFSGGLTSELGSHQIDVANWMFADTPEFVTGVGDQNWRRDGRNTYDNVSLILKYSAGRKMTWNATSTCKHQPLARGLKLEHAEMIMGTDGCIEITVGDDENPALGMWFYDPQPKLAQSDDQREMAKSVGATITSSARSARGFPILFTRDQISGDESFLEREMKYARRWLYSKGIAVPREERNAGDVQLDSFFESCRTGKRPKADLEAGLEDSASVIVSLMALDEGRRVKFSEI